MTTFIFSLLGLVSSTAATVASEKFDSACQSGAKRGLQSFYQKLTSPVIYYGYITIPLLVTIVLYLYEGIEFYFNSRWLWHLLAMIVGYSGVIVFDMLSRSHINTTLFNIAYQMQVVFIFIVKYLVWQQTMNLVQWIGCLIITGSIMYVAGLSSQDHLEEKPRGKVWIGVVFVLLAAAFRAVAINMDSVISLEVFSSIKVREFDLQWWLYECVTFVAPALCVFILQWLCFGIICLKKQKLATPIVYLRQELQEKSYRKASVWSFMEYIAGVPAMSQLPYLGPVFQGLVPVIDAIIKMVRYRKIPSLKFIIAIIGLLGGCICLSI